MKYLIPGANGQLGYAFRSILSENGQDIFTFGKEDLDITDLQSVREKVERLKPDYVINCAAYNAVDKAEEDWEVAYLVNGIGPRNLAIVCNENDIPLVHYSTDYVFDGKKGSPYTIADEPNPLNQYGKSKLLGERFVQSLCNKYLLIRTSWVFGPGGKKNSNFVEKVLSWAENTDNLKIVDDEISCPTYTFDLAEATINLLHRRAWGLYHITNSGSCSRYEWAKFILDITRWDGLCEKSTMNDFPSEAHRPHNSELGLMPMSLEISIQHSWQTKTMIFLKTILPHIIE